MLAGVTANPAASIARGGHVVRYLDDHRAVVRRGGKLLLETSTTPLRIKSPSGIERPVDLRLVPASNAFTPTNSIVPLSIGSQITEGVAVGSDGLRVIPETGSATGVPVAGLSVFYPNAGPDMDVVAAPTVNGAELFATLRSRMSPEQLRYRVVLPAGAMLGPDGAGGAVVSRAGVTLARIPAPSARDAQDSLIGVTMEVVGDELVLDIPHRSESVDYPVLVDPEVVDITESSSWTFYKAPVDRDCGKEETEAYGTTSPLSIYVPAHAYPLEFKPPCYEEEDNYEHTGGSWAWRSSGPMHEFMTEFDDVSLSATATSPHGVFWELDSMVGGSGEGLYGWADSPPPSTVVFEKSVDSVPEGTGTVEMTLNVGSLDVGEPVEAGGTLSVGAVLISSPWPIPREHETEEYGLNSPGRPNHPMCTLGYPVNCDTGNQVESQTDLSIGGRGPGLHLTRTYNSQLAANETEPGPFGYGWTGLYSAHLTSGGYCVEGGVCTYLTIVHEDNGSTVPFKYIAGKWYPATSLVQATLEEVGSEFVYTLPNQTKLTFGSSGRLLGETDRNGNAITVEYSEGRISKVKDAAGRSLTYSYNGEGFVKNATDQMGHTVEYGYEGGNLTTVTEQGASAPTWRFDYDSSHQMTTMTDGNGHTVSSEYDSEHRVIMQKDALGRTRKWSYSSPGSGGEETTITEPNGSTTQETFDAQGLPRRITRAGASTYYNYDIHENLISAFDPDGHGTTYTYDADGDRTSERDTLGNETKWSYDATHDVMSVTRPNGETTTIERDAHGNATSVSRPAPGETTQTTKYLYDAHGDLESVTDPLKREWTYEYDGYGDKIHEADPEGDVRTWGYDEDSRETSMVAPRGNAEGAEPARFTTTITRDAQGRPVSVTEPEPVGGTSEAAISAPSNLTAPEVTGTPQDGETLEASAGTWEGTAPLTYSYQWQSCDGLGMSCLDILAATGSSYTLGDADVNTTLRVVVTAVNSAGSVTSTSAAMPTAPALEPPAEYVSAFGSRGTGAGEFEYPGSVAAAPGDGLWVLDSGNDRVERFNGEAHYVSQFGSEGSGSGQFAWPTALAVDAHGDLWVVDSGNNRVEEFNEEGTFLKAIGSEGSGPGQFRWPIAIAIDSHGDLWVLDYENGRVEEFNEGGEYVRQFGSEGSGDGQFKSAEGIAVDSHDHVWVADGGNARVEEFDDEGEYLQSITGTPETASDLSGVDDLAFDASGNIWMSVPWQAVKEFSSEGHYIGRIGTEGETGAFQWPEGLMINAEGDIWVADASAAHVEKWKIHEVPTNTAVPQIVGEPVIGTTLRARTGAWEGSQPLSYAYQWRRCVPECHDIEGATGPSYTLTETDLGATIELLVTASNSAGVATASSSATATIIGVSAPTNTVAAAVTGTPLVHEVLSANPGTWTGTPAPSYSYQWRRCNSAGESCTSISEAIGASYVLGHADIGTTLRVVVTATNSGGSAASTSGPTEVIAPLTHTTKYTYDAAGNLETVTDPEGHKTTYSYDADNEQIKIHETNGTVMKTGYDAAGNVVSETDGDGHVTKYVRNEREQVTEIVDPLGRRTHNEYDEAGNLLSRTDAAGRTTSYKYDADNRVTEVSYSDGTTPTSTYHYDVDGNCTEMTDGTGTTTNTYDQLDRLTEVQDGHGDVVSYQYDLANEQTKITYPGGKEVKRTYDNAGRLQSVTDWLEHTTHFSYDPDSNLTAIKFPGGIEGEDVYGYDDADQMSGVTMKKGEETLASLVYGQNKDGQLTGTVDKGLPGEEETEDAYDANGRLAKTGTTTYKYDPANNPTTTPGSTNIYNGADELESGTGVTYTYNELGERTKTTPSSDPATTYGYDQAGNLTSVERPKEGETPKIEDSYTYNGDGLRTSQTISGTIHYLTWETTESLPLLLNDDTNSYIYGPGNLPVEQINNTTGAVTYLHHDQAGSTRLLTGSTGTVTGKCTYSAYGTPTCEGTTTTPLGYDGQYTSSDTGLIYMRARTYDPATAQFLSVDPLVKLTGAPYSYAGDNPLNEGDPTGLLGWSEISQAIGVGLVCVATDGAGCVAAGLADLDANVVSNDYEAVAESCRAGEEESSSLTDLAGFALGAGVGGLADGSLSEEARKALESTSAGQAALKQLVGLGAGSSVLTTLAYAQGHESSGSSCSCGK